MEISLEKHTVHHSLFQIGESLLNSCIYFQGKGKIFIGIFPDTAAILSEAHLLEEVLGTVNKCGGGY